MTIAPAQAVIIGAAQNPDVAELAVAAWLGEIISWNPDDSYNFPLPTLARRATIVLDVLGSPAYHREAATMTLPPPIITLEDPAHPLLALPDLLATLTAAPRSVVNTALCYACAQALAARTPDDQLLPTLAVACQRGDCQQDRV